MLSLHHSVVSLLLLYTLTDISCGELTPVKTEEFSVEGRTVTLSCNDTKLSSSDYFFWYRQHPGKPPEFLISHSASGEVTAPTSGLMIKVEQNQINMIISSAAVSDSAVYYCAVKPLFLYTFSWVPFVFGNAIKLSVSPADPLPVQPSLFILSPLLPEGPGGPGGRGGRDVCLAAGFRPQEGEMVLNLADRSVPLNTSSAALFRRDQTFFFAGFSNETIRSCDLLNTTARNQQIPSSVDSSDDSQPENVRLNSYLLLLNAARVVFTKTVAFSTVLTVRALLPSGPHHDHDH